MTAKSDEIDNLGLEGPLEGDLKEERVSLEGALADLIRKERVSWNEKGKIKWVTRVFFNRVANGRRNKNHIDL